MNREIVQYGLRLMKFARHATLGYASDIPLDKMCFQPVPNGNHALWLLGHLAWTDDTLFVATGGGPSALPAGWLSLFGWKSVPKPDASAYPSVERVREQLSVGRERLVAWLGSLDEEALAAPLLKEYSFLGPNVAAIPGSSAWHEGMHSGQLTVIRKALGLPPKFR